MANRITAIEAEKITRMHPDAQAVGLGAKVKDIQDYAPVAITFAITADATGAPVAFTAPFAMEIVDVIVQARAAAVGETVTPINAGPAGSGTDAMCTAIACAADGVVSHMAAGADDTKLLLAAGDIVKVDASANTVLGLVTFLAVRV